MRIAIRLHRRILRGHIVYKDIRQAIAIGKEGECQILMLIV